MELPLDYATLRLIWWVLLGVLLIGFAVTDGFDMGVAMLLPAVGRTDMERRVAINTVGPVWEGNQVWFILGGGAIFAAWPILYAVSFSGFYIAMFIVLLALIVRPVAFKFRSKREDPQWRRMWDWGLFIGGFVPALIFGVAVGNVLQGVPFSFDQTLRPFYDGGLFGLLNPFALLCGLLSVAMLALHGSGWLVIKAEGAVAERARRYGTWAGLAVLVLFLIGGIWVAQLQGYIIVSPPAVDGPSNPLLKEVQRVEGGWYANYAQYPWMMIAPFLGFAGTAIALLGIRLKREAMAFLGSKAGIIGIVSTVGLSMFPFILPSTVQPNASLTVWDASSSHLTLFIMFVATAIFLPIVLAYTAWVFRVLWGKVTPEDVERSDSAY
jgi:cytochrome d ubiquinol oxidase subunit II